MGRIIPNEDIMLSKREEEILILISEEYTMEEIGRKLFISRKTVETHRKNLMTKLNAKNAAGLMIKAISNGLIKID